MTTEQGGGGGVQGATQHGGVAAREKRSITAALYPGNSLANSFTKPKMIPKRT